ncbi:MAG: hypothetical protein WCI73_09940, partial [Phycisphaerae bacterium]
MMRCRLGLFAAALVLSQAVAALAVTETVELRGYGKVTADLTPRRAVFECASVEKADILLDKLQTDLFWDQTIPVQKTQHQVGAATITVYALPGYGAAVIARAGKHVLLVGGSDEAQAVALAAKEPLLQGGGGNTITSQAAKKHPRYLDFFDHRAMKAYVQPLKSARGFGIESHWPFLKSIGGAEAFIAPFMHTINPAPGVIDWASYDYEVHATEQQQDMIVMGPNGGGEVSQWGANLFPEGMMKPSET